MDILICDEPDKKIYKNNITLHSYFYVGEVISGNKTVFQSFII